MGYINTEGVFERNDDGTYEGYTYDYLMSIAQFTGWTYEFVEAEGETANDQMTDLLAMLDSGEVDLEGSTVYDKSLTEFYEYPENSYGFAHTALFVPESNPKVTPTDLVVRGSLTVAVPATAKQRREELEYFCEKNGLDLTLVAGANATELQRMTLEGEADAYLDIDVNPHEGYSILASFSARPYYFIAPKGERAVIDEIDRTIQRINESNPSLQDELYATYFSKAQPTFELADEEQAFAQQHETLRVGVLSERAPVQTFDKETGELKGVSKGVLDYLEQHAGLSFEIVRIERSDDLHKAIRDADVDLVAGIENNQTVSSALGVSTSAPYMSTSRQLVYHKFANPDELEGKRLALPWEIAVPDADLPDNVLLCDSLEACLVAVNEGEADYTFGTTYSTPYYTSIDDLNNLLTLPSSTNEIEICFGVVQPVEPELLAIIDKSIRSLSTTDRDSLIYDNALIDQDEQIGLFVKDHLLEFAVGCILLLAIVIVLLALYLRTRMKAARSVREENRRFQKLYSLAKEDFFEYSIKNDTLMMSDPTGTLSLHGSNVDDESASEGSYRIVRNARTVLQKNAEPELVDALVAPRQKSVDVVHIAPDGRHYWLRIMSHYVTDDEGRPISVIGKVTDIDAEMREKLDLSNRAHHDGLTGLLNWKTFQEKAASLMESGGAGALLVIDADDFKLVNDTYGHQVGDRALQNAAASLARTFRPDDLIGRLGGDEFAVCIAGPIGHDQLVQRCACIVEDAVTYEDQEDAARSLTLSVGGVELEGGGVSFERVYHRADEALYRAKAEGKNRYFIEPFADEPEDERPAEQPS